MSDSARSSRTIWAEQFVQRQQMYVYMIDSFCFEQPRNPGDVRDASTAANQFKSREGLRTWAGSRLFS